MLGHCPDGNFAIYCVPPPNSPLSVAGLASGVVAVSLGDNFMCASFVTQGPVCTGGNSLGQLGDGTYVDRACWLPYSNFRQQQSL